MFICAKVLILSPFVFRPSFCSPFIFTFTGLPCHRMGIVLVIFFFAVGNFCGMVLNP